MLVLPKGYRCVASAPLKLNMVNGAELISYAPLHWRGSEDAAIKIFSADSSSHGIHVIGAEVTSTLSYVAFRDPDALMRRIRNAAATCRSTPAM